MDVEKEKILASINPYTGSTVSELSKATGINKKRVKKIVAGLGSAGYVLHDNKVTHCHL